MDSLVGEGSCAGSQPLPIPEKARSASLTPTDGLSGDADEAYFADLKAREAGRLRELEEQRRTASEAIRPFLETKRAVELACFYEGYTVDDEDRVLEPIGRRMHSITIAPGEWARRIVTAARKWNRFPGRQALVARPVPGSGPGMDSGKLIFERALGGADEDRITMLLEKALSALGRWCRDIFTQPPGVTELGLWGYFLQLNEHLENGMWNPPPSADQRHGVESPTKAASRRNPTSPATTSVPSPSASIVEIEADSTPPSAPQGEADVSKLPQGVKDSMAMGLIAQGQSLTKIARILRAGKSSFYRKHPKKGGRDIERWPLLWRGYDTVAALKAERANRKPRQAWDNRSAAELAAFDGERCEGCGRTREVDEDECGCGNPWSPRPE